MAGLRFNLPDFALANPIYAGAQVSVYTIDPAAQTPTTTLATLYDAPVGDGTLTNPQQLDGDGKWQQPVYVDQAVVMDVLTAGLETHQTGIIGAQARFRGEWEANTVYLYGDTVIDGAAGADTSNIYTATITHTSGTWADDLLAGGWLLTVTAPTGDSYLPLTGGTLTGPLTVGGALVASAGFQAKTIRGAAGNIELTGAYNAALAPIDVRFSLVRVPIADVSTLPRDINRIEVISDKHNTRVEETGIGATVVLTATNWVLGAAGGAIADSWDGSRVVVRNSIVDRNSPASALIEPDGTNSPPGAELNVLWSGMTLLNTRGGKAPEIGYAVGRNFVTYISVLHRSPSADGLYSGAQNLSRTHLLEGGFFMFQKSSVLSAGGIGLNVAANRGVSPVYEFTAFTQSKTGATALGFRLGFGASGWALHGMDPIRGVFAGVLANRADPLPKMLTGLHLSDLTFSGPAIRWPGGEIKGGAHSVIGTGRLRVGTGYLSDTTTGVALRATGYVGRAAGYVFLRGTTLTTTDPKIRVRPSMIANDNYGGSYRLYGIDPDNNQFTRAVCLTAPIWEGASPPATLTIGLRDTSGGVTEYEVTETGTTTVHPTQLTAKITDFYVGRTLTYLSGPAAGESQAITAYNATTGELTTNAFSINPTENLSVVDNNNFGLPFPSTEDTIVNGWQYTLNGGGGSALRVVTPVTHIQLTGDGSNPASMDQEMAFSGANDGIAVIWAYGTYRIKIGSTRGGAEYEDRVVTAPPVEPGADPVYVVSTTPFYATSTVVWIRIENISSNASGIRNVRVAEGDTIIPAIRAAITTPTWEVTQSWTQRNRLDLQDDGGPTVVGGTLAVVSDFAVATNKFTVAAASGAVVGASTFTGGSFIPTSSTTPTIGMYKPAAANTLGWAINSTAELYLDGTALYPTTDDGLALGKSGSAFSDAYLASGAVLDFAAGDITLTHASNTLTFAGGRFLFGSATDDGSTVLQVNGTAKITGTATLAAFNAFAASSVNLSGTTISSVAGLVFGWAAVDGLSSGILGDARGAAPQIILRRANGTSTAMTALASADPIGAIQFRGHDGSALTTTRATIEAVAAETWTASANGANLLFKTTTIGTVTAATTRMTLTDAGNLVMATGAFCRYSTNISAAVGTTRTDALQLTREFTRVSSAASGTGVILPTGVVGMYISIYNNGANAIKVYANGSETIDGTAGSTGVTLSSGAACVYVFTIANTWHSFLMGGRSA